MPIPPPAASDVVVEGMIDIGAALELIFLGVVVVKEFTVTWRRNVEKKASSSLLLIRADGDDMIVSRCEIIR
jgi:hypothetical protein